MPLPIDVKPYDLMGIVGGDNYLTHYKANDAAGEEFVITEFFPAYMVKREDDGALEVSERFTKEFVSDRDGFIERAKKFLDVRDSSLHPVVEILERNHTAYIVRRACGLTSLDAFMGSQTMDFDEAYYFIRPLLISMAQVAEHGMVFNINDPDFRVNSFKQLVLCSPPAWERNFHPPLIQMMKLYYKLLTGVAPPDKGAPPISSYGIEIPSRIETVVMEILSGDILYGSLDDFYKRFKSLIDGATAPDDSADKKTLAIMRSIVAALFVLLAFSFVLLVIGGINAFRIRNYWASPDVFADTEIPPAPEFDFSGITLTHPRNTADTITGCFAEHDGYLFFRGEAGLMSRLQSGVVFIPGAMGVSALSDDRVIVENALPSYIVAHDKNIYFIDANNGGAIFTSSLTGGDLTRLTEFPALNLAVLDGFLYYTNVEENHHLYRMNLKTNVHEVVNANPVFSVASVAAKEASGNQAAIEPHLFYVQQGGELFSWNQAQQRLTRISSNAAGRLR
ncbi:MAG: DUF5050 domain-containing protein, partial [Clostridiales bacterium]|nr:DUF5050 domain-containing protein [Clostridiales bacterium]